MYKYKGYDPKNDKHVQKYKAEHYKQISVIFDKEFYSSTLKPYCESVGISVASFVKEAVKNEMERRQQSE